MISKKILSEVLAVDIISTDESYEYPNNHKNMVYFKPVGCHTEASINIYELAHKCKEWVSQQNYALYTGKNEDTWIVATEEYFLGKPQGKLIVCPEFTSDTEPEAIFKACEWILEQKEIEL